LREEAGAWHQCRVPEFRLSVTARAEDIDELQHVSNIVYVKWMQDAAVAHSASVGWGWQAYLSEGGVFVARRHEIDYLAPAVLGDAIDIVTRVESFTAVTSLRRYVMTRASDGRELVRASTTWAFVSTSTGRPQRIPKEISAAFFRD
jgi:acyl-CoA thioester hydrolase